MATTKAFIRTTQKDKEVNIRFRYSDGRGIQLFHTSEIIILQSYFDEKGEKVKAKAIFDNRKRREIDTAITERKNLINKLCGEIADKNLLSTEWLEIEIVKKLHPENYEIPPQTFFECFEEFLEKHPLSDVRRKNYRVVFRALKRFELYTRRDTPTFTLKLDSITPDTLQSFSDFLKKEHIYFKELPELYAAFPEYHEQKPRGQNTINGIFTKLKTFFLWCAKTSKKTNNRPFENFKIDDDVFGTPFYITIAERNALYKLDLTTRPELEKQRDIFVFQCVIGCRVSDLYAFTKANIIDGEIHYIAQKTRNRQPKTIKVPLNSIATEILNKYADFDGKTLFPFISQQKYNNAIKKAFAAAEITRSVVICDPLTRENVIVPINDVASSHLARRCFVGNLYEKIKDKKLTSELSGHTSDSKAFDRYVEVNKDVRKELITMIE